jgi:nicotinamidase-related amidase
MNKKDIDVEIYGFCTDICVVSNALILKAAAYDYANITVDSKCCAGVTKEKHEAALEVMRSCQINII